MNIDEIYKEYYDYLKLYILKKVKTNIYVDDILQKSFLKIHDKLHTFDGKNIQAWITVITRNTLLDYLKTYKINNEYIDYKHDTIDFIIDDNESYINNLKSELRNAVNKLSQSYKDVVTLYAFKGYTHNEIGEILNISPGTSKSNYHKAKENIKKLLN